MGDLDCYGDFSYHDIPYADEKEDKQEHNNWQREKAELEDKVKFLVEQAKRQDDMLVQMWTKMVRLESTIADNKRLAAENKHLKSLLRRHSSLTTMAADGPRRRPSKTESVREILPL